MEPTPTRDDDRDRVIIFDTTLRDGEQSPGATMSLGDKLRMAEALAQLGVDVIEAGFPIASPGDFEAVRTIARRVQGPIIAGLARCAAEDIGRAWDAVRESTRPRLHVFLATSAIHREHKLHLAKAEILARTREYVDRARSLCDDVEFSPEDASRTEPEFLAEVVTAAVEAGATTINVPDTVGYAVPDQFAALIQYLRDNVPGIDETTISVHCHDDLGLAVANSLAAVQVGARQVECTINGIGERAGNASLEEVVMALRTRADTFGVCTGIDTPGLYPASRLLSNITGMRVQANKAIVGANAFAHEAGIHQHGMLQHRSTYEIMKPEDVGVRSELVLGKHSGRHAFRERVRELGFDLDEERLQATFEAFKRLADQKRTVFDEDIAALVDDAVETTSGAWQLVGFQTMAGTDVQHVAEVRLRHAEHGERQEAACGDGPIDAVFRAIERVTGVRLRLQDFQVRSVTGGKDAQGEVSVMVTHDGVRHRGRAVSTDVVEAAAEAYMNIVNRVAPAGVAPSADAAGGSALGVAAPLGEPAAGATTGATGAAADSAAGPPASA